MPHQVGIMHPGCQPGIGHRRLHCCWGGAGQSHFQQPFHDACMHQARVPIQRKPSESNDPMSIKFMAVWSQKATLRAINEHRLGLLRACTRSYVRACAHKKLMLSMSVCR